MALAEVYGRQPEELSFQANHRWIIKRKYLICTLSAMANMHDDGGHFICS